MRRVVWRFGKKGEKWKIFCYLCVSFGDRPAAALLEICVRIVVELHREVALVAAHRILNDRLTMISPLEGIKLRWQDSQATWT